MGKIIIENRSRLSDNNAIAYVMAVMKKGRISGLGDKKQYCYHTIFFEDEAKTIEICDVSAFLNKQSDRFVVHHNDGHNWQSTKKKASCR